MDLEHALNQSWTMFSSGVPVYKDGGRLVTDEFPTVQLPIPNGMSPDAAALGNAPSPTFGNNFSEGTVRAIGGGLRDTAQGVLDVGAELIDNQSRMDNRPQFARDAVKNVLPNWEPHSIAEGIARTGVNVVSALMLTRTLGMGGGAFGNIASGAVVDMLMDPTEGNLSTLAREFGFDNELTQFLDNQVAADAGPEERLRARMLGVLEGAGLGGIIDGVMRGFKVIKDNPEAAAKVVGGLGVAGLAMPQDAEGGPLDKIIRQVLKQDETLIKGLFKGKGATTLRLQAMDEVNRVRSEYADGDGWRSLELVGGSMKDGKFVPQWKKPDYGFDKPPAGVSKDQWKGQIVDKVVASVDEVVQRAAQGDKEAEFILSQASWYRDMRSRLRDEFGGMADLFADLLGTTSAQTNVRTNWDNAVEIMRRFSRGEYDKEIANYERAIAAGEDPNKMFASIRRGYENSSSLETRSQLTDKQALAAALEDYPMLTKAAGTLFGTNSPTSAGALIDTFRQIKNGASPKTPNFTGNLIGYTNEATVDVWAARFLTDLAGLPRIPPPAEKAVTGKHGVGSTLENPRVGGEFGFGQEVFREAAERINAGNIVPGQTLGPDDLQAVAWFIEKEKWTKQGWTNKAGEGGSLDFEANRAGTSDPAALTEARRVINAGGPSDADRVAAQAELDQAVSEGLLDRIDGLRKQLRDKSLDKAERETLQEQLDTELYTRDRLQKIIRSGSPSDADRVAAQQTFEELAAPVDRTVVGISGERPGRPMSNYAQAELAAEIDDVLRADNTVVMYKATSTYGRFMKQDERALDVEVVTRKGFDPSGLERRVIEMGKEYDQDAVFISRVMRGAPKETDVNARPGVEIYFSKKQSAEALRQLTDILTEKGIDGFTFVTDMRHSDRVNVQAKAGGPDTAGLVGVRFQYIPEFDDAFDAGRRQQIMEEKLRVFRDVVEEIGQRGGVSSAQVVWYDTKVIFRDQYDVRLGSGKPAPRDGGKVREGQLLGSHAPRSDHQGGSGSIGSGAVPDR